MKLLDRLFRRRTPTQRVTLNQEPTEHIMSVDECVNRWEETKADEQVKVEVKERLNFAERAKAELDEQRAWLHRQRRPFLPPRGNK
jgi:hypothetical protein